MANVISARGISFHIEKIIKEAKEKIILITPYLKINSLLFERLALADKNQIEIIIVYGKTKLTQKQEKLIDKLENCRLLFKENLHAKIYLNENSGIISSMNLYDFSEINNTEIGVFFEKSNSEDCLYSQAISEVDLILNNGEIKKEPSIENQQILNSIINGDSDFILKNYPIKNKTSINKTYGFITYCIEDKVINMKRLNKKLYPILEEELSNYRIYWNSPFDKIFIYHAKKIDFKTKKEKNEYEKKALIITNNLLISNLN